MTKGEVIWSRWHTHSVYIRLHLSRSPALWIVELMPMRSALPAKAVQNTDSIAARPALLRLVTVEPLAR